MTSLNLGVYLFKKCVNIQFFYQETLLKNYQNFKFQQPYQQAFYYCSLILGDRTWPLMDKLAILSNLGAQDLDKFVPTLLSSAYLECFIAGLYYFLFCLDISQGLQAFGFNGSLPRKH